MPEVKLTLEVSRSEIIARRSDSSRMTVRVVATEDTLNLMIKRSESVFNYEYEIPLTKYELQYLSKALVQAVEEFEKASKMTDEFMREVNLI